MFPKLSAPCRSASAVLQAVRMDGSLLDMSVSTRADKWLWATRFFKTRAIAAEILGHGKLLRNGHSLKRGSSVQVGDVLEIPFIEGPGVRKIVVSGVIEKRVGAPEAQTCYEDRTKPGLVTIFRSVFKRPLWVF
jgi:ribosome-associated heat shock protein Hsp15